MRWLDGRELEDAQFWLKAGASNGFGHSRCERDKRGAVIVDSKQRLVGSGYNALPKYERCNPKSCEPTCRYTAIHTEVRAIGDARRLFPERLEGSIIYPAHVDRETGKILDSRTPHEKACEICAPVMAEAGIAGIVLKHTGGIAFYTIEEYSLEAERQRGSR